MSELVKRLRDYQESWWEAIQRLDMGESDNGIMTTIRFEQHDTFKKAADLIEHQEECIAQMSDECLGLREDCENVGNLWEKEVAELRAICRDAYEIWAGSAGIPEPQTCSEAYLLQLLLQMRDEVKRGLK